MIKSRFGSAIDSYFPEKLTQSVAAETGTTFSNIVAINKQKIFIKTSLPNLHT
jgi:hypothetical protein